MSSINIYLRENLAAISAKNVSIAPNIEEKKLNNAVKAFGYSGNPSNVIGLFDNTLFGSGKDGIFFYWRTDYIPSFVFRPNKHHL